MIGEWIRFIIAAVLLLFGLFVEVRAILGVYRMNYVMNRMQVAAMGDTMGLMCILVGLMILGGFTIMTAKMIMILLFFWLASPVSSHMIAEIEIVTNPKADHGFEVTKP